MANNIGKTNACGFEFLTNQGSVGEEWRCEARVSNPVYKVSLLSMIISTARAMLRLVGSDFQLKLDISNS